MMKGFVLEDINKAIWRDVPEPVAGPEDAIIKPVIVAPCTTDKHLIETMGMPHIQGKVLGHEMAGIVQEVGSNVKDFKKGDRVIVSSSNPNWKNPAAQMGLHKLDMINPYMVEDSRINGCFAELFFVPDADMNLAIIPDNITWEQAVILTDMGTTAFECVDLLDLYYGDTVLILGVGPVGLAAVRAAYLKGAGRIFVVGSRKVCFDVAKEYGATDFINYKEGNIVDQILKINGKPVDAVAICGGQRADIIVDALRVVKVGGKVTNCSVFYYDEELVLPMSAISYGFNDKQFRTVTCNAGRAILEKLLALVEYGRFQPEKMITQTFHGMDKIEEGLQLISTDPNAIKPVVFFD